MTSTPKDSEDVPRGALPKGFEDIPTRTSSNGISKSQAVNVKFFMFLAIIPLVNLWAFYRIQKMKTSIWYFLCIIIVNAVIAVVFNFNNIMDLSILNIFVGTPSQLPSDSIGSMSVLIPFVIISWIMAYASLMKEEAKKWNQRCTY